MKRSSRYKGMQLPQLRGFCVVAMEGNFTVAAKVLGVSVPTVWEQVRTLERKLQVTLLRLRGRSLELTPEGRLLLDLVQPHVQALDSLERLFEARLAEARPRLTVASTHYLLAHHLDGPLHEFARTHPDVQLTLWAGMSTEVSRLVERGQADLGVAPQLLADPATSDVEYEPLFDLQFTLLTSASHPLAKTKRITPHNLGKYPLIMPPPACHAYRALHQLLRKYRLAEHVHVIAESVTVEMSAHYAALGMGIALAYLGEATDLRIPNLHQRLFNAEVEALPVAMLVRKYAHRTEPVEDLRHLVRRFLADRNTDDHCPHHTKPR